MNSKTLPVKTIERLILYKRLLANLQNIGQRTVYSYQLAQMAGNSAEQVRRDLMQIGFSGNPKKGYVIQDMLHTIDRTLNNPLKQKMVLIGVGNLGRAILSYFTYRQPHIQIVAAFDVDPSKVNRVIGGCRCYPMEALETIVTQQGARLAILTVPPSAVQKVSDQLVALGIKGILNFAPLPLKLPADVICEQLDIALQLEKLAFLIQNRKK